VTADTVGCSSSSPILGPARLETTQLSTKVSIQQRRSVHAATPETGCAVAPNRDRSHVGTRACDN
jgi:hypothetical protein